MTWPAVGVLFGAAFAFAALLGRSLQLGWAETMDAAVSDPLLWITMSAPAWFGVFAYAGGRHHDRVRAYVARVEGLADDRRAKLQEHQHAATAALAARDALLAGLEEGVATFDAQGNLSALRSAAFDRLVPHAAQARTVDRLLELCGAETETVAIVRTLLWDDGGFDSPFEATTEMLPQGWRTSVDGQVRHLTFRYRPLRARDGRLSAVMITVADETPLGEARCEHDETLQRVARLSAAATDPEAYTGFVNEVAARLETADQARAEPDGPSVRLLTTLHTLKGTLGLFAFREAAGLCHELERAYAVGDTTDALWAALHRTWRRQSADIAKTLGLDRARLVPVAPARLVALRQALGRGDLDAARRAALELRSHPLSRVMARYARYVHARAERAGKQVRFAIADLADEVAYHEVQRMDAAFIHVFNNVVAHAAVMGAPVRVTVSACRREDGGLSWTIEDDGVGIDTDVLAARAVQLGLRSEEWVERADHAAKLELVFHPKLSSRSVPGAGDGRGVGLAAARTHMRVLGGDMRVSSARHAGTRFQLWVAGQASMDLRRWTDAQASSPEPAAEAPAAPAVPVEQAAG